MRLKNRIFVSLVMLALGIGTILFFVRFDQYGAGIVPITGNGRQLKLVHIIARHGIRTPADTFPTDPHINASFYPTGWGQLTNAGKKQMYELGKFLRSRYGSFLGTQYSPDEYYGQSTDVDRTRASLQLINAGLWPPDSAQKWGPLDWQPIPIHYESLSEDGLLLVRKPCAQYHLEFDQVIRSDAIQKKFEDNQWLFDTLENITGKSVRNFDDIQDIYSTLTAEEEYGLQIYKPLRKYYPGLMREPTIFSFQLNAYNDKLIRLKGGVLLKKLLNDWQEKSTNQQDRKKAYTYVGHDSTIVNLLSALKIWEPQVPNYGTTILLEFSYEPSTEQYGIEVFLRNTTTQPPYQLTVPNCDRFCHLERLAQLTAPVIPLNWQEECQTADPDYVPPPPGGP